MAQPDFGDALVLGLLSRRSRNDTSALAAQPLHLCQAIHCPFVSLRCETCETKPEMDRKHTCSAHIPSLRKLHIHNIAGLRTLCEREGVQSSRHCWVRP